MTRFLDNFQSLLDKFESRATRLESFLGFQKIEELILDYFLEFGLVQLMLTVRPKASQTEIIIIVVGRQRL